MKIRYSLDLMGVKNTFDYLNVLFKKIYNGSSPFLFLFIYFPPNPLFSNIMDPSEKKFFWAFNNYKM